jgi:hypothetical protein
MNEDIQERIEKPVEGEAKTLKQPEQPLQENTCNADEVKNAVKARRAKRVRGSRSSKRKSKFPRLHRPKKESTRTITTRLYKAWAQVVHSNYGEKCAVTGETGILDAHHIIPRQVCSGMRFDPENGILLSKSAHKFGKFSAHKNGVWFADWLQKNEPRKHAYCLSNVNKELDCKNRMALYAQEVDLHDRYADVITPIAWFDVIAYDADKRQVHSVVKANNKRAAEYIFWNNWPKTDVPKLKGIWRTEEVRTPSRVEQEVRDGNA